MKKILVAAVATMVAFAAGNVYAQCIGCQQNAQPVFNSAPIQSFGTPIQSYGTPIQSFGTPCLLYTSPSPRDRTRSRMPSSA